MGLPWDGHFVGCSSEAGVHSWAVVEFLAVVAGEARVIALVSHNGKERWVEHIPRR